MAIISGSYLREGKHSIVVFNECAIGYVRQDMPNYFHVLNSLISKGYCGNGYSNMIGITDKIRLANEEDFETFKLNGFNSYANDKLYHFERPINVEKAT